MINKPTLDEPPGQPERRIRRLVNAMSNGRRRGYPSRSPAQLMLRLPYRQLEIRIDNDPSFTFGSADNPRAYDYAYRVDDEPYTPTSLHTVSVVQDDETMIASSILGAAGGASGVHEHSAIIHADSLLIAVGPFVVALQLPTLALNWKVRTDWATCFGVYHSEDNRCYISHGELDVAAVSYDGSIMWSNSGADIFTNGFSVSRNRVTAIDWNEDKYVWEIATGHLIETTANKRKASPGSAKGFAGERLRRGQALCAVLNRNRRARMT